MVVASLGVHLVGSLCGVCDAPAAFCKFSHAFMDRLRRIPDGEPAERDKFIIFQREVFRKHCPQLIRDWSRSSCGQDAPTAEVQRALASLPALLETGYDVAALGSYASFCKLRADGTVPRSARFQVCLPPATAVMSLIETGYQAAVEPIYEEALLRALARLQEEIPHADLAVQIDVACEIATLERVPYPQFAPYYPRVKQHILERITALANAIREDVELGVHLCYGDLDHTLFVQPEDAGLMVDMAAEIAKAVRRPLNWVHLPVPKHRDDDAYFLPLRTLELGETELYLGLVHAHDEDGTKRRLVTASRVLGHTCFGVGTECGLGRTPAEDFESIAQISTLVSSPVDERS